MIKTRRIPAAPGFDRSDFLALGASAISADQGGKSRIFLGEMLNQGIDGFIDDRCSPPQLLGAFHQPSHIRKHPGKKAMFLLLNGEKVRTKVGENTLLFGEVVLDQGAE
jgi:hypothetical protein